MSSKRFTSSSTLVALALLAVFLLGAPTASAGGLGDLSDQEIVAWGIQLNEHLAAEGWNIQLAEIEFYTQGGGRPDDGDPKGRTVRILQQPFRWVPGDIRRIAQGNDMTFIVDDLNNAGPTSLGFFPTAEVRLAQSEWFNDACFKKVTLAERPSPGGFDITIFDGDIGPFSFCPVADLGVPGDGFPFAADIVHAGWYPASCFGFGTLAFSVTFIFLGGDSNGDGYLDTALNEVYYNDAFGNPATPDIRSAIPWNVGQLPLPNIDVRTVGFHESGHSLGVGHFGPPPTAVMNPVYAGPLISPLPIDHAGMCTVWSKWPK